MRLMMGTFRLHRLGPGSRQPARRRFHQRTSAAQPHPPQNRRDGGDGDSALRHFKAVESLTRMRIQNIMQVSSFNRCSNIFNTGQYSVMPPRLPIL